MNTDSELAALLTGVSAGYRCDTLFRFELNLRESLILGIVGAGGVGFYIQACVCQSACKIDPGSASDFAPLA